MKYTHALKILNIDENTSPNVVTTDFIKKAYRKQALKIHPDKNKSQNASEEFKELKDAYDLLLTIHNEEDKKENMNINETYIDILKLFMNDILSKKYKDIIHSFLFECEQASLTLFKKFTYEKQQEIYNILYDNKDIFHLSDTIMNKIRNCMNVDKETERKRKMNIETQIYILNPSIDDLMLDKIYKLNVDNNTYMVPLWHDELYYTTPNNEEIIVKCNHDIKDINIDDENNLYINKNLNLKDIEEILTKGNKHISVNIGNQLIRIPLENLKIQHEQTYIIRGKGISKINEIDIYNVNERGDLNFNIVIC